MSAGTWLAAAFAAGIVGAALAAAWSAVRLWLPWRRHRCPVCGRGLERCAQARWRSRTIGTALEDASAGDDVRIRLGSEPPAVFPPAALLQPLHEGDLVIFPPIVTDGEQLAAMLAPYSGRSGDEQWRCEFLPESVPEQLRHLRNADGSVNRDAFVVLRGPGSIAPYVNREKEQVMGDPNEPGTPGEPAPDPTPPPNA